MKWLVLYSREQKVFHVEREMPDSPAIDMNNGFIIIGKELTREAAFNRVEFWESQELKTFEKYLDTLESFHLLEGEA